MDNHGVTNVTPKLATLYLQLINTKYNSVKELS